MLTQVRCVARPAMVTVVTMFIGGGLAQASVSASPGQDPEAVGTSDSVSAPVAAQLATVLADAELGSIAAREGTGRFVAALHFPGRLLVVSAEYEVPVYIEEKVAAGSYREVYIDLNTASVAGSKLLVTDTSADGLRVGDAGDSVDMAGTMIRFENAGDTRTDADARYAAMRQALLDAVP